GGREEAAPAFLGAVRGTPAAGAGPAAPGGGMVFVLDVGGGSTELILGTAGGAVHGAHSVDVGAVRVTELCVHSDPISLSDWALLLTAVRRGCSRCGTPWRRRARPPPGRRGWWPWAARPPAWPRCTSASKCTIRIGCTGTPCPARTWRPSSPCSGR